MLNRLKGVFESFQKHDVRYLVIGSIASILYGVPRATFDLDILIEPTPDNAQRLLDSLLDAGLGTASLTNVEPPRAEARGSSTCFVGPAFAEAASRRQAEPSEAYPTTLV